MCQQHNAPRPLLEAPNGERAVVSAAELPDAGKINKSYLCRLLHVTLLPPDIVEAIPKLQLGALPTSYAAVWASQRKLLMRLLRGNRCTNPFRRLPAIPGNFGIYCINGRPMPDEILTLPEVAEFLKVAEKTIYTMVQRGEIPAFKVRGQWRFEGFDLDQWIKHRKTASRDDGS